VSSISKTIDWKITLDEDFLDGNVVQARKFPIINQRDNRKICDLNLQIENRKDSSYFSIESSPVSVAIFFKATVALLSQKTTNKKHEAKFGWTECRKGQELSLSRSLTKFPLSAASRNLDLDIRCEVTSELSKIFSIPNLSFFYRLRFYSMIK
jgi:hypothetical protein